MSSPKKRALDFGALAAKQVHRDLAAAANAPNRFERAQTALAGPPTLLNVDDVVPRHESTRDLEPDHVKALAESIGALGLIEPVVVDSAKRLLAGGHRLEAIKHLRAEQPEVFARWFAAGVPVRTMDFDADASPARALEVEIAENEHRRDYTGSQIKELANRLRAPGYRDTVGRPKLGEKALGPALEVIVGKSMKTIRKLLNDSDDREGRADEPTAVPPLAKARRALEKHRTIIPEPLHVHLDALLAGLDAELQSQGEAR
jgi:ParB family chromosome partitioning protein